VVTKDIPAGAIVAGNTARLIKFRAELVAGDSGNDQR